ncbi:aspartate aminotransferase family protein [Candidatus Poriferisocius sp.]|uniref:aspartate aminotransferase family protein n=1 Tax=Candidatus Poriferisocius sp. TaxID=3101276 RepID=UPI003B023CDC
MTGTTSAELHQRYRAVLPSYVKPLYAEPISIERGRGSYVWDVEGNRYLDFFGGVLTTMVGHNNPVVTGAIQSQAAKVLHTSTLYLCEPMIELAEEIAALSGIPDARVFFTTSGTEANDTAILLATSFRRSNEVLALRNSYHGRSFTAQALTSHSSWSSTAISGLSVSFVHGPYRLRSPFRHLDDDGFTEACTEDLRQVIDMMTTGNAACLIAEPIQGVGGFATPPDGFFGSLHKVLANRGILFVSDEVQTGWGRTGEHFWGYQAHDMVPDMLTFAKGVGNGITLAGIVARAEIMDTISALSFSTFGGNPLSAAAGLATLRYVRERDLQGNALRMGTRLRDRLLPVVERTPWIAELRGKGLMQAIEMVQPGSIQPDAGRATDLLEGCKRRGLLVGKGGLYGNAIRITPMLDVAEAEIDEGVTAIVETIQQMDREV